MAERGWMAGMAAAAAAAAISSIPPFDYYPTERKPRRTPLFPQVVPNDIGPVIDSTKESKRARRRRLARERNSHD